MNARSRGVGSSLRNFGWISARGSAFRKPRFRPTLESLEIRIIPTTQAWIGAGLGHPWVEDANAQSERVLPAGGYGTPSSINDQGDDSHFISSNIQSGRGGLASNLVIGTTILTTTTVTSDRTSLTYGQSVTFTATVTASNGTPLGSITFDDNGIPLPKGLVKLASVGGLQQATYNASLSAGNHVISADYLPADAGVNASSSGTLPGPPLMVAQAPLTISVANLSKVYGTAMPQLTVSYVGLLNGDTPDSLTVLPTLTTTATASSHVAGGPYAITASGAVDTDYSITYTPGSLTVTPKALTITAVSKTKVYGAAMPALTTTILGLTNGDSAASLTSPPTLSTAATASSHVAGSPYAISASGAADSDYNITYVTGLLTVTPKPLMISAVSKTKLYGAALPALTMSIIGLTNGDSLANLTAQPTLSTAATATSHVAGGPYTITASGAVDSDYTITYIAGALTVTPKTLMISAVNKTKVYGAALPAFTSSIVGLTNGDTSASLTVQPILGSIATAHSHVTGGPYAIIASGAVDPDYAITYIAGSLTVTPKSLIISSVSKTKVYGAALPTLTTSIVGLTNGDTSANLTVQPTLSTSVTVSSHVTASPSPITVSGASDSDYTITYTCGSITITPVPLTITPDTKSQVYGTRSPLTASYSGLVNGDTPASLSTLPTLSSTATSSSHVMGSPYAISATGAIDHDYVITYGTGVVTVTPASLTITADDQTVSYGSAIPTLTATFQGFIIGDSASSLTTQPTLSTTAMPGSPVSGNTYPITVGGAVDADYAINYLNGALTITDPPVINDVLTSYSGSTSVYGQAVSFTADLSPIMAGSASVTGTVQFAVDGQNVGSAVSIIEGSVTSDLVENLHAGIHRITASYSGDTNYPASTAVLTQTVTPASLSITASNQTRVYGQMPPTLTASYSGLVNGDSPDSLTTPATLTTNSSTNSDVGSYTITASGAIDPDYDISYVDGTEAITPAPLTITADNQTKVYGDPLPTLSASYSGLVNGDTPSSLTTQPGLTTTATASSHVIGAPYAITVSGAADPDYTISYAAGSLTVTPAALTVTADYQFQVYGSAVPSLTASYTGLVNGDTSANLINPATLSTTATASSHVAGGPYAIIASGAVDSDYVFTYGSGSLTVTPAPLTIAADYQSQVYGSAVPSLTASYTGLVNGDTAASLTSPATLSTIATAASHVAGGPYVITVRGAADLDYAITYLTGTLIVTPASLTIGALNATKVYGSAMPSLTANYTGLVNGDTSASLTTPATLTTTATAGSHVAGGPYSITVGGAADTDYAISYLAGTLTVMPAPLTITAGNATKLYGSAVPTLTTSYTGLVNGDTQASLNRPPTVSTNATTRSHVAAGTYAINVVGAVDTDYAITYLSGSLSITPAPLTIVAVDATKVYGSALPTLTASYTGLVNGDTLTALTTRATLSTTATASSHVAGGPYAITVGGAVDTDYAISYTAASLTVTAAPLTIGAVNATKVYGSALPTLTASYTGLVNGDTSASLTNPATLSTTATASSHVAGSPYPINVGGAADSDYAISYASGSLTVTPVRLQIIANAQVKISGAALPTLTANFMGFVAGDTATSLATPPTLSTTALASSNTAGKTFPITAVGAVDSDYTISYLGGILSVVAGPATKFVLVGPTRGQTNLAGTLTVTAQDQYGNLATSYAGKVHFTSNNIRANLPSDTSLTAGQGSFTIKFATPGLSTVSATDSLTPSITGMDSGTSIASVAGDIDGDGKADLSVFGIDPKTGRYDYRIIQSSTGKTVVYDNNGYGYGNAHSIPIIGDFFGDGRASYALWTPNAFGGMTFTAVSPLNYKSISINFGAVTDLPVVGDVDGDGKDDFGVYGYQPGLNNRFDIVLSSYNLSVSVQDIFDNNGYGYGNPQSIPLLADFDGSGKAGFGLFNPSAKGSNFAYVNPATGVSIARTIGTATDTPMAVNFDGDGKADLSLYGPDPAKPGHYRYLELESSNGFSSSQAVLFDNNGYGYGNSTSLPVMADFEGDGKADFGLFTADGKGGNEFVYLLGQTGSGVFVDFATATDIPLTAPTYLIAKKIRGF